MYLKKLYNTNKWWFAGIMLFVIVQLAMDIRQDIAFSPVYHYGMYSETITPQKQYSVIEITVNGKKLRTQDFTPAEWDKIAYTVALYNNQQAWNINQWNTDIKRLLHLTDSSKYVNNINATSFNSWYKNYLQPILNEKVDSVAITTAQYQFNSKTLTKTPG